MTIQENISITYQKKTFPKKTFNLGMVLFFIGLIGVILAYIVNPVRASFNSIVVFAWITSFAVGSMFFIGIEYLTGAVWSVPFRRVAEILSYFVLVLPIFAIPIIVNIQSLYHWSHIDVVKADEIMKKKSPYLNQTFFVIRYVITLILWFLFFYLLNSNSRKQDKTFDHKLTKRNTIISAIFMPVFAITMTFFAIDWLMSLEPRWYSTIFGVYYFAGSFLAFLGAFTFTSIVLNENGYLIDGLGPDHYYSMGALIFAFTNFWAYIAFSQFMLIWYANLPEETFWFINRGVGSWFYLSIGIIFVKFIFPYILLLPQPAKMDPRKLKIASLWVMFAHYYDLFWIVMPTYSKSSIPFNWIEIVFPIFAVGLLILLFQVFGKNINLVPIGDPKLKRGIEFHL